MFGFETPPRKVKKLMVEILRGKQKKLENTIQLCYHCQYLLAHATPILWDPESTKRCRFC